MSESIDGSGEAFVSSMNESLKDAVAGANGGVRKLGQTRVCEVCGEEFALSGDRNRRRTWCGRECHDEVRRRRRGERSVTEQGSKGGLGGFDAGKSGAIRSEIAEIVMDYLPDVERVMAGELKWSSIQLRAFGMLLNKVVPQLSGQFVKHEVEVKHVGEMSREELQKVAQGLTGDVEVIEGDVVSKKVKGKGK